MNALRLKVQIAWIRIKMFFTLLALRFIYRMMCILAGRKLDTRDFDQILGDPHMTDEIKKHLNTP